MNKSRRQKVEHLTSVSSVVKKEELQEGLQETSFMYISNHSERKATHFLKFHLGYFFFRSTKTFTYILNNRGKLSIRQYRTTGLNSFKKLSNSFEIRDYYIIKRKKNFFWTSIKLNNMTFTAVLPTIVVYFVHPLLCYSVLSTPRIVNISPQSLP